MSDSVLVIEDDDAIRDLLEKLLETRGFVVHVATDGADAFDIVTAQNLRPSVIVLDLAMPVMDGFEFLGRQADLAALAGVPVIVLSARARADRITGLPSNVRAIVQKPIQMEKLAKLVQQICDGPRSRLPAPLAAGSGAMEAIDPPRRRRTSTPTRPLRLHASRSGSAHATLVSQALELRSARPEVFEHAVMIAIANPRADLDVLSDEELRDLLSAADDVLFVSR